jgi:hypothetical protein
MSRIRNAWRALMGNDPEPEKVEVAVVKTETETILGSPEPVTVFHVTESHGSYSEFGFTTFGVRTIGYYATCEQAHSEHPGKTVKAVDVWRVGSTYLTSLKVTKIDVKKPKRAKGAK